MSSYGRLIKSTRAGFYSCEGFRGKTIIVRISTTASICISASVFSPPGDLVDLIALISAAFLVLFLVCVVVEATAVNKLAGVYQLGARGAVLSATIILTAGVVATAGVSFGSVWYLSESTEYVTMMRYLLRFTGYVTILIWALLMRTVYKKLASTTGVGAFSDAGAWHLVGGVLQILLFVGLAFAISGYRQLTKGGGPTPAKTPKALLIAVVVAAVGIVAFAEIGYIIGTTGLGPLIFGGVSGSGVSFDAVLSVSGAYVFFNGTVSRDRPEVYDDAYVYVVAYMPGVSLPRAVIRNIVFDAAEKPVYVLPIPRHGGVAVPLDFVDVLSDDAKNPVVLLIYPPEEIDTVTSWIQGIKNLPRGDYVRIHLVNGEPISVVAIT